MNIRRPASVSLAVALLLGTTGAASQRPSVNQRPTSARAAITGSPTLRDGSYTSAGAVSSVCGELGKFETLAGEAAFVIEFPADPSEPITSITFSSKQLVGGVARSTRFLLSVGVVTPNGGRPPHYVLNTDPPSPKNTGTATLTADKGTVTLQVTGRNEAGESIDLSVTCR